MFIFTNVVCLHNILGRSAYRDQLFPNLEANKIVMDDLEQVLAPGYV